jgi:hypothetical protein
MTLLPPYWDRRRRGSDRAPFQRARDHGDDGLAKALVVGVVLNHERGPHFRLSEIGEGEVNEYNIAAASHGSCL